VKPVFEDVTLAAKAPLYRAPVVARLADGLQLEQIAATARFTLSGFGPRTMTDEKALFTKFWINETRTTSKVLSRIPEGSTYRPDAKSRTAQEIAWQIVCEEKMLIDALETGTAEWAPTPVPASMKEVSREYDRQSADIARRLESLPASRWNGDLEWFGSKRPAPPLAWSFLFDIVHHRGQITTYLRPMGSTVPQVYGPSADEP
jgi:uncharacterized damage-inducible protein DinB